MNELFAFGGTAVAGYFAIMNPIANTPIFLSLTADDDAAVRRSVARRSLLLAFVLILVFSLAGKLVFELFGISMPALRITGGILVFMIGLQMLHGSHSAIHRPSEEDTRASMEARLSVAVSPLAVPILAGPGTVATAMNFAARAGLAHTIVSVVAFALICVLSYFLFCFGERLVHYLGDNGLNVITRVMGLILATIGTQMLLSGLGGFLKTLGIGA